MISDELYADALRLSNGAGIASTSLLRMACRVSYIDAVRLIDRMEFDGIVQPATDASPRQINRRKAMQLQQTFDARQVEPSSFPPPPPLADYHVRITDSEAKPTSDQTGGFVEFQLEILDPGPFLNRKVPYRLNLFNKSQQAVEIAYRQLSALCWVTGVFQVNDTRQLHNIPFVAQIGPQANQPQYSQVFNVKDVNGNLPGKGAAPGQPPAQPAAAPAPPAWAPPQAAAPPAAAPPQWGAPPAAPAQPPAWAPPQTAAPAPPAWGGQPVQPVSPQPAPPWQPAGAPAAPPWAQK